jgi:hypothetical protein
MFLYQLRQFKTVSIAACKQVENNHFYRPFFEVVCFWRHLLPISICLFGMAAVEISRRASRFWLAVAMPFLFCDNTSLENAIFQIYYTYNLNQDQYNNN